MANEVLGLEITELRLGLPGDCAAVEKSGKKRTFSEIAVVEDEHSASDEGDDQGKNRVVGWPPICSFRQKNTLCDKKNAPEAAKMYVKVSMDGAPFLRKIDLNVYKGYSDLSVAFRKLFGCFGIANNRVCWDAFQLEKIWKVTAHKANADSPLDIGTLAGKHVENSEYVPIYEDKDGDWMLVGDVPWEMFIESCKRLRIMKRSEANGIGLQSRDHHGGFRRPSSEREAEQEG